MADITGTITGTTSNDNVKAKIEWSETINVSANTGTVQAKLYLKKTSSYADRSYSDNCDFNIYINGEKTEIRDKSLSLYSDVGWVLCGTATVTVAHDSNGTKSIVIKATGNMGGTSVSSISCSGTAVLYQIPRASAITSHTTSVDVNGTNKITVNISRKLAAYTHRVRYYIGTDYATATYKAEQTGVGISTEYAIPTAWRLSMPTTTSITAKVEVTTFNGATQIGNEVTASFTLTVPTSVKPIINQWNITLAPKQPSAISGFANYVQGYSECEATFMPNPEHFGSEVAISEKYVTYGSLKDNVTPYLTGVLNTAGTITLTVGVKDARGRTTTQTRTITVQAYSKPTANGFSVFRCDNSGVASEVGGYISVKATRIFSSVGGNNSVTAFRARYKATTAGSYGSWTNLTSGVAALVGGGTLLTTQSYDVQVQITDAVGNTSSYNFKVPTAATAFNLKDGGRGVGFGKYAETDELADFDYPLGFSGDAARIRSLYNLTFLGSNLDTFADTPANWAALGTGWAWFSNAVASSLAAKPHTYGILLNIPVTYTNDVHQLFLGQSDKAVWHRGGNASGWSTGWKEMWDSANLSLPISVSNGGTGQTTAAAARNALGLGNTTGAVPVANGGTGATSLAAAQSNLGFAISTTTTPAVTPTLGTPTIFRLYKVGKVVTFNIQYSSTINSGANTEAAIIPAAYRPADEYVALAAYTSTASTVIQAYAKSDGTLMIRASANLSNTLVSGSWVTN